MKKIVFAGSIVACAAIIIVSFFMPWARASVNATKVAKNLADSASGKLQNTSFAGKFVKEFDKATNAIGNLGDIEVKTTVSGYDIPTLINKKSSNIAIQLAQILFKDAKDLDKKSMLVYLLPLFAIVCIILAVIGFKYKVSAIATALIGGAIGIGGLYKLMSTDLSKLPVQIAIENGLWQTMYGYLLICILSIAWLIMKPKE
ncbi:MAG: hypothetical protein NTY76_03335 [Candidatus Omnitrophica bacterium]|nr:hypothetical protein [Candidatus Omnitrophota bacterium]